MMAYRATPQESTMLILGRGVELRIDLMIGKSPSETMDEEEYVYKLHKLIENAHAYARQHLGKSYKS